MSNPFDFADTLGPSQIVHINHPGTGLQAIVVIDNVACGPAIGGTRMAPDVSLEECFRLARAMTLKNAAAGLPHGGAKSVIFGNPSDPAEKKETVIRQFATEIRDLRQYIPGPDMGTNEQSMAWVQDEIGRSVGLPREIGGIPLDDIGATGLGVAVSAQVAQEFCDVRLQGARVAVQGFGAVGRHAARFLREQGAVLVAASDSGGTIYAPDGIDLDELLKIKRQRQSVTTSSKGNKMSCDDIIGIECDIWIPAARPDILDESNIGQLNTKLVIQGANIPATLEAELQLHQRGVLCIPDFIANAGGVICASVEYHGGSEQTALSTIREKIAHNVEETLAASKKLDIPPRQAAERMAQERVRAAMNLRRWG